MKPLIHVQGKPPRSAASCGFRVGRSMFLQRAFSACHLHVGRHLVVWCLRVPAGGHVWVGFLASMVDASLWDFIRPEPQLICDVWMTSMDDTLWWNLIRPEPQLVCNVWMTCRAMVFFRVSSWMQLCTKLPPSGLHVHASAFVRGIMKVCRSSLRFQTVAWVYV